MKHRKQHWEDIYQTKSPVEVSWFQPHLKHSLELVRESGIGTQASVIDVGAGASTLADDLIEEGYRHITVLDISREALEISKKRLGEKAQRVQWLEADILQANLPAESFDLWHDRAVFHFLTSPDERAQYIHQMNRCLKPGGTAIIATFSLKGPERCSGLDVVRYSPETLQAGLGSEYTLIKSLEELHQTPGGKEQAFIYCMFKRQNVKH